MIDWRIPRNEHLSFGHLPGNHKVRAHVELPDFQRHRCRAQAASFGQPRVSPTLLKIGQTLADNLPHLRRPFSTG